MSTVSNAGEVWRWRYHLVILAIGLLVFGVAAVDVVHDGFGWDLGLAILVGAPLIMVVARFPMVLDSGSGAIEVGFDSSILIFLMCTLDPSDALVAWSVGVLATQLTTQKTASARSFNIGLGMIAGGLATAVYSVGTGDAVGTPRELVTMLLAAATYFITDFVLSAVSVTIWARSRLRQELLQRGTLLAIACFVPLDSLGYLGAVVQRATPWWTLSLLGVPLVTLLIATRAVTRGQENARRLTVLFSAAVRAQALVDREAVIDSLLRDARQLLKLKDVRLRDVPPVDGAIAVPVQLGDDSRWLVARARNRARATVAGDEQALRALAAVAADAISRLELTDEMVHVARHDPLTDLPNRGILLDRLTHALARQRHDPVALLFIDLDGFKPVNDRYGHAVGDDVLVLLATRLRRCVRSSDTVARLGGDEFAILFEDVDRVLMPLMCDRVLGAISEDIDMAGQTIRLGASVGLAYGVAGESAASLLRNADLAMYEAKTSGKAKYVEYEPAMGRARLERLELVDDLRQAVDEAEIDVVYQPVVAVGTEEIVGVEALARWRRNDVQVAPDVFIAVAEETGLIVPLGEVILDKVAADAPALLAAASGDLSINVNISAVQLRAPEFIQTVARAVEAMHGTRLVLEITERQGIDLDDGILAVMRGIESLGVVFAIDDFGVGFSSISYLHDLPARILKADAALSQGVDHDVRARALLRSVMLMGRSLGYDVIVEGIERESQLQVVRDDAPTSMAQGYLMYRPMPLADLLPVMRQDQDGERAAR
ncbi:EAL domain-containing protein [Nocardioides sp. CER19]|uniref:putative bifunctional diguanylate cyclase/phosphodiesterase n=1 Tax=Nocardioides sp. CER19 TaxID=3038538 RepID=UPI00244C99A9|nr:EAL domain-containing protein [Nocardioides sp. CER19]MDH2414742.1 EAL domain-containing protein [Nocardioides sp. CER19]